ncbi:hypothetical protein HK102_005757 [Quaeritorhiza haematococci]|nr:hypothetical protein HK102_005757 [Quaeritorhiza haematococci]
MKSNGDEQQCLNKLRKHLMELSKKREKSGPTTVTPYGEHGNVAFHTEVPRSLTVERMGLLVDFFVESYVKNLRLITYVFSKPQERDPKTTQLELDTPNFEIFDPSSIRPLKEGIPADRWADWLREQQQLEEEAHAAAHRRQHEELQSIVEEQNENAGEALHTHEEQKERVEQQGDADKEKSKANVVTKEGNGDVSASPPVKVSVPVFNEPVPPLPTADSLFTYIPGVNEEMDEALPDATAKASEDENQPQMRPTAERSDSPTPQQQNPFDPTLIAQILSASATPFLEGMAAYLQRHMDHQSLEIDDKILHSLSMLQKSTVVVDSGKEAAGKKGQQGGAKNVRSASKKRSAK